MPHKHKRKYDGSVANHDLPPTQKAKPLPVGKQQAPHKKSNKSSGKAPSTYKGDDTPRAFTRLLQFAKTGKGAPKGIDDGIRPPKGKKRKRDNGEQEDAGKKIPSGDEVAATMEQEAEKPPVVEQEQEISAADMLKIQPGERLSDFNARVDRALPLAGISAKGKKVEGIKERRTKHEKRLRKLQAGWREDEAKIKEKEEEERERAEEEWEEKLAGMDKEARELLLVTSKPGGLGKKKKKKSKLIGEVDEDEGDPWAVLNNRREAPKGVFDVAQAPPKFTKIPREIFKAPKVVDVPREAGSLRRREELGQNRADIIKSYRAMMAAKRSSA